MKIPPGARRIAIAAVVVVGLAAVGLVAWRILQGGKLGYVRGELRPTWCLSNDFPPCARIGRASVVETIALSADGRSLYVGGATGLRVASLAHGAPKGLARAGLTGWIRSVALSADGRDLYAGMVSQLPGRDVWQLVHRRIVVNRLVVPANGGCTGALTPVKHACEKTLAYVPTRIRISADGGVLAAMEDGFVVAAYRRSPATGALHAAGCVIGASVGDVPPCRTLPNLARPTDVVLSGDGRDIYVADAGCACGGKPVAPAIVWLRLRGDELHVQGRVGLPGGVGDIVLSKDGRTLLAAPPLPVKPALPDVLARDVQTGAISVVAASDATCPKGIGCVRTGQTRPIVVSPDGADVAIGNDQGLSELVRTRSGRYVALDGRHACIGDTAAGCRAAVMPARFLTALVETSDGRTVYGAAADAIVALTRG